MPQSESVQKKSRKASETAKKQKTASLNVTVNDSVNDSVSESKRDETPSKMPETQATITQLFKEGKGEKSDRKEERSTDTILKSLEMKMSKLVTVDHLQEEFKKMITEEFLSSKLETLKIELKSHFDQELETVYAKIEALEQQKEMDKKEVEGVKNDLSDMETKVQAVQSKNKSLEQKNTELSEKIKEMSESIINQEIHLNDIEQYTRRNNIRIYGIDDRNRDETAQETTYTLLNFFRDQLSVSLKPSDIDIAHRMGRFQKEGNRIVICRFVSRSVRNDLMKKRSALKGSTFVIRDDLTRKNAKLLEKTSEVENVKSAWSDQGKIIALIDGDPAKKETVVVTLKTDLSGQLKVPKRPEGSILNDRD